MSELEGIYAVWLREAKIYIREKERLVSAMISPLLWIFGFGAGVGTTIESVSGYSYQMFIYPGIMVMTVLFASLFYGVYIIWDRKLDFLKEVGDPCTGVPIGSTENNLKSAVEGETYEYTEMYPGFGKTARNEGFEEIAEWFETLARAEKSHAGRFAKGLEGLAKL